MWEEWESPQRILVILAHPDDPEFFCGATVASWTASGHTVSYLLLTCGDKGSDDPSTSPDELCQTRYEEQRAAARRLGVEQVNFLGYPDGHLVADMKLRQEITRFVRQDKPDIVVTCDPSKYYFADIYINHPDHRAAGQATLDAVYPAAGNPLYFPELIAEGLQPHKIKEVWISSPIEPNLKLDITKFWEQKIEALQEHKSQIGEPEAFVERMNGRHTPDSSPESPRYEEHFRRIVLR